MSPWKLLRNYCEVIAAEFEERRRGEWDSVGDSNVERPGGRATSAASLAAQPFVLVQTSRYGQTWITLWPTAQAACDYHADDEFADDWTLERLVDIRTMTEYRPTLVAEAFAIAEPDARHVIMFKGG